MLGARLVRFHNELVHPLRLIAYMLAAAESLDSQADGFIQAPRFQFDGMLDPFRIDERHAALLHAGRIPYFAFYSP